MISDTSRAESPAGKAISKSGGFHYQAAPLVRKQKARAITFQRILDDVLNKDKWQEKWTKIKQFVRKKPTGKDQSEKDDVFSAILALYAGEEDVFSELNTLYDKYPTEVEFYIP